MQTLRSPKHHQNFISFTKTVTNLLCHLLVQEDQICLALLAFPEDQGDPCHPRHQWDQGYPKQINVAQLLNKKHLKLVCTLTVTERW